MLNNFVYRIPWTDATPSSSRETEQQRYWVKKRRKKGQSSSMIMAHLSP